ncbi:MAG: carboxypeptidase regulatory-like domain-containing protein, partial [Thermomicrobiaceae bacterium]|nr:carboxypeptidase regulatory-like domain-containing protein [Thermomicrobiaceae bacterium]
VPEATVIVGSERLATGRDGTFSVDPGTATTIVVEKPGYDRQSASLPPDRRSLEILLRPDTVRGVVRSAASQQPIAGAKVEARVGDTVVASTTTDQQGAYALSDVPEGARLSVDPPDFAAATVDIGRRTVVDLALRPDVLVGKVTDDKGAPIAGALVAVGKARASTGADGAFRLQGAPAGGKVVIKAPGYRAAVAPFDSSLKVDARLQPLTVKALYATAETVSRPDQLEPLLQLIDRTELNAIVVDLKDSTGQVYYETGVRLAHDIGAVHPLYDPRALVASLHQRGIYVIGRIVVFEDPILAEARPEWAIHDSSTGGLWRTWNGLAWVNAHRSEVWDYDIALATEAAGFGFDEIQFDYIRFPSDGPLNRADYGVPHDDSTRPRAIRDFLTRAHDALAATPTYLSGDVFGLTLWEQADSGIGQHLEDVVQALDYVCPMVYPSHFAAGSMGFDVPNDHPYEVILWSLQRGEERVPRFKAKLRPWLQDFSLGGGISYGDAEVRAQIRAAEEFGATGWMLWNAANVYHEGALKPR